MRILVLESVSGLRRKIDPKLFPEGFGMLRTILNELNEAGFSVVTTVNRNIGRYYEDWLSADNIFYQDELEEAIKSEPDLALPIAPETGGELERIIQKLERKEIMVLGAGKESIRASRNKWITYNTLQGEIPQPQTWDQSPESPEGSILTKPKEGTGAEEVQIQDPSSLEKSGEKIFQKFIGGEHVSCCLLMGRRGGKVLSVNRQKITNHEGNLQYLGNIIPLNHAQEKTCRETALRAAQKLGLYGYCGVDLVLDNKPYFVELNPRLTTSFIGLAPILRENLGELLINTIVNGHEIPNPHLRGCSVIIIPKTKRKLKIQREELKSLKEVPQIIAPPTPKGEYLEKGTSIFVGLGRGNSQKKAEEDLEEGLREALARLEVEKDDISWT